MALKRTSWFVRKINQMLICMNVCEETATTVTPNWIKTHSNIDIARNQFNRPTSVFQTDTIIASILHGGFQFIKE